MTVTINYVIQNQNSEYEVEDLEEYGVLDPQTQFPGIYGNREWSFEVAFSGSDDETGDPIEVQNIIATTPAYVSTSYTANTNFITLFKNTNERLFEESYDFVKFDTQEYSNLEDFEVGQRPSGLAVVGWNTPSIEVVTATYVFEIEYIIVNITNPLLPPQPGTESKTYTQLLYWDFRTGMAVLDQLVSESEP